MAQTYPSFLAQTSKVPVLKFGVAFLIPTIRSFKRTQQFFKRYQGIISNYSITEDWNEQMRSRVATVGISCASFRTILENRVGGVRTTPKIWQAFYPNDNSMNRVPVIAGSYFDFGGEPTTGSQSVTTAPSQKRFGL